MCVGVCVCVCVRTHTHTHTHTHTNTVEASQAFAVCGDFVGQSSVNIYSGVEAAALSGLDLAAKILSSYSRM